MTEQEKNIQFEKYNQRTHLYGRVASIITLVMLVGAPFVMGRILGAMPDMAAIEGVLNYEKHDYIYFCARAEMDGRHNFARTLNEHNRNAQEYHRALDRMKIRK